MWYVACWAVGMVMGAVGGGYVCYRWGQKAAAAAMAAVDAVKAAAK